MKGQIMELKIINKKTNEDNELLEISTEKTKIVIGFGDEIGARKLEKNVDPQIEGLTVRNSFI